MKKERGTEKFELQRKKHMLLGIGKISGGKGEKIIGERFCDKNMTVLKKNKLESEDWRNYSFDIYLYMDSSMCQNFFGLQPAGNFFPPEMFKLFPSSLNIFWTWKYRT